MICIIDDLILFHLIFGAILVLLAVLLCLNYFKDKNENHGHIDPLHDFYSIIDTISQNECLNFKLEENAYETVGKLMQCDFFAGNEFEDESFLHDGSLKKIITCSNIYSGIDHMQFVFESKKLISIRITLDNCNADIPNLYSATYSRLAHKLSTPDYLSHDMAIWLPSVYLSRENIEHLIVVGYIEDLDV